MKENIAMHFFGNIFAKFVINAILVRRPRSDVNNI